MELFFHYSKYLHQKDQAILAVGSLWYTAWANAGMPDLSDEDILNNEKTIPIEEIISANDSTKLFMNKKDCDH